MSLIMYVQFTDPHRPTSAPFFWVGLCLIGLFGASLHAIALRALHHRPQHAQVPAQVRTGLFHGLDGLFQVSNPVPVSGLTATVDLRDRVYGRRRSA